MIWHHYKLNPTVSTANDHLTLWSSERGSVTTSKGTFAVAVTLDGKTEGYIFSGNGKLILDTIIETDRGAIGKPIEKEISTPFLMLGNPQLVETHLSSPGEEQKDFLAKAEDLHRRFFKERGTLDIGSHDHHEKRLIFAFDNSSGRFDLLIPHGSRLVYKSKQFVFVSDGRKVVLKSPEQTVVSDRGRCIIVH